MLPFFGPKRIGQEVEGSEEGIVDMLDYETIKFPNQHDLYFKQSILRNVKEELNNTVSQIGYEQVHASFPHGRTSIPVEKEEKSNDQLQLFNIKATQNVNESNSVNILLHTLKESEEKPEFIVYNLIDAIRRNPEELSAQAAEQIIDYFLPVLDQERSQENLSTNNFQIATIELLSLATAMYPERNTRFTLYLYKILTNLLILCRHAIGTILAIAFRCFSIIWMKKAELIQEEYFYRLIVDFILTFTPTHTLFSQAVFLLRMKAVNGFSEVQFIKLLLKLKVSFSTKTFELIDYVLSKPDTEESQKEFLIRSLFQVAVSKSLWSQTATSLIAKYKDIIDSNKELKNYCSIFCRRTVQWIALSNKLQKHTNREVSVARALYNIQQTSSEQISKEISTDVSTLMMSGKYQSLEMYFESTGAYDQTLLDEIDVLNVPDNLLDLLAHPQEKLSSEQLRRIELRKKLQLNSQPSEEEIKKVAEIMNSANGLPPLGFLKTIVFALIATVALIYIF